MCSIYTREELLYYYKNMLETREKNDNVFFLHQKLKAFCIFNNDELKQQAKLWRKSAREGKIQILKENCMSSKIEGKEWFFLVVQPTKNLDDYSFEPVGACLLGVFVSGFIYCFEHEVNRDIIRKYVMDTKE